MKNIFLAALILTIGIFNTPVFSQIENDTTSLGLPGDNLDLYAVLDLFQKSKTIEDFEKSLNEEKTGINNLDLNLDNKVDFIKVVTNQKDKDFTFILQVDVTEKETQDVAVILVSKDKNDKVTMQIVGDAILYGKDYVIEPKPPVTTNPGYTGTEPVKVNATTTVVVVESAPIVQYVYSPVYVPYYPPYHYAYYPPYYAAFTVMAVSVYHHNNYYHHGGYHGGGYGNTVVIHNTNNYNNYNKTRNTSNTVKHNNTNGNYNKNNVSNNKNNVSNNKNNVSNNKNNVSNNKSKGTSTNTKKPTTTNQTKSPTTTMNKPTTNKSRGNTSTMQKSSTNQSRGNTGSRSGGRRR